MPKSKRDKKISLTKTTKKGLVLKQQIVEDIRDCATKYKNIFLISVENMRNNKLKSVREEWKNSRFFFGKNKVMALALGKTPESEVIEGVHKLANKLKGQCGLLFTNKSMKQILQWADEHTEEEYARAGFVSEETITLQPEDPLPNFQHSMEPELRRLGMPTTLKGGVIKLIKEFEVCKKNQTLTSEQATILKHLGIPLATFKIVVHGMFSTKKGFVALGSKEMDMDVDVNNENVS